MVRVLIDLEQKCTGNMVITDEDLHAGAVALGCEMAAVKAIVEIEAPRGPFDDQGRPTILFERHLFSHFTGGKFDEQYLDISNPVMGGYGKYSEQYRKLSRACELDSTAALRATSWGAFQILANNFVEAGFGSPEEFVASMWTGASAQLDAFVWFIRANRTLHAALQEKQWVVFARLYNGPSFAVNAYDKKLAAAYAAAKAGGA